MPDPTGQAPNDSGQAPQTSTVAPTTPTGQAPAPEQFGADYVKQLRAEAADYRTKLRELEQKVKIADDAKLSETERTQKRLAELEREQSTWQRDRQELTTRHAIERAAAKLGIVDPDAAYRLLDPAGLEFAEDGSPKDLDRHLKDLLKARPYLAGQQPVTSGSPTNPATGGSRAGTFSQSQVADRAFWNANKDAIMQAMAEGRIVPG